AVLFDPQGAEAERVPMRLVAPGTDLRGLADPGSECVDLRRRGLGDLFETWRHAAEIKVGPTRTSS
ncbi:hypothetical protein, partial [Kocuria flava]|uniref:hypothetical protein n=1 Tax=Kocuria flava TaxID=446860 RepID=UPI0015DE6401